MGVLKSCINELQKDKNVLEAYNETENADELLFVLQSLQEGMSVSMIAQALQIHNQRNIETSSDIVLSNVSSSENIPHDLEKNSPSTVEKIELPKKSNLETGIYKIINPI